MNFEQDKDNVDFLREAFRILDINIETKKGKDSIKIRGVQESLNGLEFRKALGQNLYVGDKRFKGTKAVNLTAEKIESTNRVKPSSPAKTRSKSKKQGGQGIGDGIKKILNRTMDHAENGNFEIAHNLFHSIKDVAPKHVINKVRKYLNHIRDNHHQ